MDLGPDLDPMNLNFVCFVPIRGDLSCVHYIIFLLNPSRRESIMESIPLTKFCFCPQNIKWTLSKCETGVCLVFVFFLRNPPWMSLCRLFLVIESQTPCYFLRFFGLLHVVSQVLFNIFLVYRSGASQAWEWRAKLKKKQKTIWFTVNSSFSDVEQYYCAIARSDWIG